MKPCAIRRRPYYIAKMPTRGFPHLLILVCAVKCHKQLCHSREILLKLSTETLLLLDSYWTVGCYHATYKLAWSLDLPSLLTLMNLMIYTSGETCFEHNNVELLIPRSTRWTLNHWNFDIIGHSTNTINILFKWMSHTTVQLRAGVVPSP